MKKILKIIALACMLAFTSACQKAVREHENFVYKIEGEADSNLYPVEVSQVNEDVLIKLKTATLTPEIFSIDSAGTESKFNFDSEGKTLIVPAKFSHIVLRHAGEPAVGIFKEKAKN